MSVDSRYLSHLTYEDLIRVVEDSKHLLKAGETLEIDADIYGFAPTLAFIKGDCGVKIKLTNQSIALMPKVLKIARQACEHAADVEAANGD